MHHRILVTLLTTPGAASVVLGAEHVSDHWSRVSKRQDGPTAPDSAPDCTFWDTMLDSSMDCKYFEDGWDMTHEQFLDYNPSVKDDCSGIKVGNSYCVEVNNGLPRPTSKKSSSTVPATTIKPTPTGIKKPSPTQSGLIESCTDFYFAEANDRCEIIVAKYGTFTYEDFVKWNPAVGPTCGGIWAQTYYCVGVPGTPTVKPSATPTPTGIQKPSPTQSGLIDTCTSFYFAVANDRCDSIVAKYGTFTYDDFVRWNPAVGATCSGIWAETYHCVGVPGTSTARPSATTKAPTPTPTPTGNTRPSPVREGMIETCNKYHFVVKDDTCDTLVQKYGTFSRTQFIGWNPSVESDCRGLWLDTWFCIGVPGTNPVTTTRPSTFATSTRAATSTWTMPCILKFVNGAYYCVDDPKSCNPNAPANPQPSPICGCKKWHKVADKDNCDTITKLYGISRANFDKWNSAINNGGDCKTLWLGYNVCVGA